MEGRTSRYSCSCERLLPLGELFYCLGCQASKCVLCVNEAVIATYCRQCLENASSAEVVPNRGRCAKCFLCPVCGSAAKLVSDGAVCLLRCVHCPWDSAALAVAPSPAGLIQLLREQERGGAAAQLFRERLAQYQRETEEKAAVQARQQLKSRAKKARALLANTPAKDKYFSFAPVEDSPGRVGVPPPVAGLVSPVVPSPIANGGAGLARLEEKEEAKNKLQFGGPSSKSAVRKGLFDTLETEVVEQQQLVERQRLISITSKHCGTCDKLLIKLDVNPSNSLDATKNRTHVAAIFILSAELVMLSPKQMRVTFVVGNPMVNEVLAEFLPCAKGCRYTIGAPQKVTLEAAPAHVPAKKNARVPLKKNVTAVLAKNAPEEGEVVRFGVVVSIQYEGVLGKQATQYKVMMN